MEDESVRELGESDVYALLADRRRRLLLRLMQDFPTPMTTREVTDLVTECEYEDPTPDLRRVVRLSLTQTHLPMLEEAGVVTNDWDVGLVGPGPTFGVLIGALENGCEANGSFVRQ